MFFFVRFEPDTTPGSVSPQWNPEKSKYMLLCNAVGHNQLASNGLALTCAAAC